jgi:chemotaxis-related protein WspD
VAAVPLALAALVAPASRVHRLPHRGSKGGALLGIVNDRLLPTVSLAALIGIDPSSVPPPPLGRRGFARLPVLTVSAQAYVPPVDEVHAVLCYAAASLRAPAATLRLAPSPLLAGLVADSAARRVSPRPRSTSCWPAST